MQFSVTWWARACLSKTFVLNPARSFDLSEVLCFWGWGMKYLPTPSGNKCCWLPCIVRAISLHSCSFMTKQIIYLNKVWRIIEQGCPEEGSLGLKLLRGHTFTGFWIFEGGYFYDIMNFCGTPYFYGASILKNGTSYR